MDIFERDCPYYLAMGMPLEEYWYGDPYLVRYYREAEKIRRKKRDEEMWLQGMYIYNAFCCAHPLFNPFAKSGTQALPYPSEPFTVKAERDKIDAAKKREMEQLRGRIWMDELVRRFKHRT